ncbi:MAG: 2-amino-4-hydroxy-6-hydroxymethyldihydropteridine diphosphokinase [Candidatus Omnitrophota bacterium]|nr:MAG: 2-amino-4-hydroxy-6-hydroxymethyldihydropteridine diphosphokinase [Candidatus Omnitrophota bacterium]
MVTSFIGIGSNLGDRARYITVAIRQLKTLPITRVSKISRIIETLPQEGPAQGKFLNCVVQIETELFPYQLLQALQKIEASLDRVRTVKNAPRTIDLDILLYADISMHEEALCIPHPRILRRAFVLGPLKEIAPDVVNRLLGAGGKWNNLKRKKAIVKKVSMRQRKTKNNRQRS